MHPVIVGYDGSASSRNALAYASGLARNLATALFLVHVVNIPLYGGPLTAGLAGLFSPELSERWLLDELGEVADHSGVEVVACARRGSPARELAAAASEYSADALVIGAPTPGRPHFAGSVPGWLIKRARCPVIVVP